MKKGYEKFTRFDNFLKISKFIFSWNNLYI